MKNSDNLSVLFVTRKKRIKSENIQTEALYARITVGGERIELSLSYSLPEKCFNSKAQRCLGKSKEARNANDFISLTIYKINESRKSLILENEEVNAENLKKRFLGIPLEEEEPIPTILELYEIHNSKIKELIGIDVAQATHKRHQTSKVHVERFIKYKYGKDDLPIDQVDFKFLSAYEHYFKTVRKCNHNSTMKYIKNLGKVVRMALAEGFISQNPFDRMKMTYQTVNREILSQQELDHLKDIEISEGRLDRVRDMFLFCSYTGLAFIDIVNLKMSNIYVDADGTSWIKNKRTKTKTEYLVPLSKIPLEIIDKYQEHPDRQLAGKVIPKISNQKYNEYLKELAIRCKINKNLSSHIARHTFATTVTLENSVPLEIVSKMLGHTNLKTTQIYAKVKEKAIKEGMKNLLLNNNQENRRAK